MIKITPLLHSFALLLFFQPVFAEPSQKFQSLSKQEKASACQTATAGIISGTDSMCNGISNARNRLRGALSRGINRKTINHTELLLIERRLSDKNVQSQYAIRKADVYTYDYQSDTLTHKIINLSSGNILHTETVQNVQLPLTDNEIERSKVIANDDPLTRDYLEKEYLYITGERLQSVDQLKYKAFVFLAKSMPGQINEAVQACGLHRCARLVMHTADRIALLTAPIIDLSTGTVIQRKVGKQ